MSRQKEVLLAVCILFTAGCVSIPVKTPTQDIRQDELKQDVYFLAQPALKGRKTGSWESPVVRRFLTERFKQYGLIPWAQCTTYEQDFQFGTNVIGVLPGSDPNLAREIVMVSAHYDHIGVQKWRVCPGACDNASSVAAMLEIAERLSLSKDKPKRTICFAAFDAEEMGCLGSFAFTCREDYDDSKIAAVINMDLLGRDLLDVVDQSLFVTGTEHYARIEDEVSGACTRNDLKFIPLGADLIGPVGDHIAFTSSRRPVLFFTCGINKDYHQPTDTADKLNFGKLKRESDAIQQTLLALANADADMLKRAPSPITHQTVNSFVYILDKIKENRKTFKLEPNDVDALDDIIAKTRQCDPNTMTRDRLLCLEREMLGKLLGLLKNYNKILASYSEGFVEISKLYAIDPDELTKIYRQVVRHYLTHKPTLFGNNEYAYCGSLPVSQKSWGLTQVKDNEYYFGYFDAEVNLRCDVSLLSGVSLEGGLNYKLIAMKGPLRSIVNAAFLGKSGDPNGFHGMGYGCFSVMDRKPKAGIQDNPARRRRDLWQAMDADIRQKYPQETALLQGHACLDPNWLSEQWTAQSGKDPNIWNLFITSDDGAKSDKTNEGRIELQCIGTLKNSSAYVEDRVDVLAFLVYRKTRASMMAIADHIDDRTSYTAKPQLVYEEYYPLRYHPIVSDSVSKRAEKSRQYKDKTLGQISLEKLKKATKKDFGMDKQAWRQWIEKHYR